MGKKAFFEIELATSGSTLKNLTQAELQLNDLAKAIREAKKAGKEDLYTELRAQQELLKKSTSSLRKELSDSFKDFERQKAPTGSLVALRGEYSKLIQEISLFDEATRRSQEGLEKINKARSLNTEISSIEQGYGDFRRNVGNYKSAFVNEVSGGLVDFDANRAAAARNAGASRLGAGAAGLSIGPQVAVAAAGVAVKEIFDLNLKLSDLKSDIAKTAELSNDQVDSLANSLESLDTRTGLDKLLQIAAIGGQLGITSEEGLFKFTQTLDLLTISLGDTFAGGADEVAEKVGKLSNVLFGATTDGELMSDRMLGLGNALNVLAAKGQSTEDVIVEMANRMGGILGPIGATQGEILGLSAAMDELAINPERGATAVVDVISLLGSDIEKFAKNLKLPADELKETFNANPIKAFQQVATAAFKEANGDSTEMLEILKDLGITGQGAREVFFKLAESGTLVAERIDTATESLGNYNSLSSEAEKKNENLAGAWERLKNKISETSSSPAIEQFFSKIISGASKVLDFVEYIIIGFNLLISSIKDIGKTDIRDLISGKGVDFSATSNLRAEYQKNIDLKDSQKNKDKSLNLGETPSQKYDRLDREAREQKASTYTSENEKKELAKRNKEVKKSYDDKRKIIEDQEKRISDLKDSIQQLSNKNIQNQFDKELAEINRRGEDLISANQKRKSDLDKKVVNQKGGANAKDKIEYQLIQSETEAIKQALDQQRIEVSKKREEAILESRNKLIELQDQNLIALKNAVNDSFKDDLDLVNDTASYDKRLVELGLGIDINKLEENLKAGVLTREQYDIQVKALTSKAESDLLQIENKAASDSILIAQKAYGAKLELIKAEREAALRNVDFKFGNDKSKLQSDYEDGKIDSSTFDAGLDSLLEQANIQKQAIVDQAKNAEILAANEIRDAKIAANEASLNSAKKTTAEEIRLANEKKNRTYEIIQAGVQLGEQITNSIAGLEQQGIENDKRKRIGALEQEYEKKLELANGNATIEKALKRELEDEKLKIEKEAFERNKKIQIAQTLINSALGATAIFAVPDFTFGVATVAKLAALAITTATSLAQIRAQEFAFGGQVQYERPNNGVIRNRPNAPKTKNGDNLLVYARPGETFLTENQTALAAPTLAAIGVPGFAFGGQVPYIGGLTSKSNNFAATIAVMTDEQIQYIASQVALASMEGTQAGAYVGSKEGLAIDKDNRQKRNSLKTNSEI